MGPTPTDGRPPRRRNAPATRQALVRAAIAQFTRDGFAKASIDRVAAAANVTKGAVYHHFADKEQLFEGAFIAVEDRFFGKLEVDTRGVDEPRALLGACIDRFLIQCHEPEFLRITVLEAPAALGWDRWKELEGRYLLGKVAAVLDTLRPRADAGPPPATLVMAAASAAGFELRAVPVTRAAAERKRLATVILAMVDVDGD